MAEVVSTGVSHMCDNSTVSVKSMNTCFSHLIVIVNGLP